ncbi:MAG: PSD1 and planctomycete cytochrome C domain-containing protein [Verrucomicrobiota bacterium]|nr:PSD1 and planctomycete cytochrome C domain-containing protein [Verrucomicrobiota bacterium]
MAFSWNNSFFCALLFAGWLPAGSVVAWESVLFNRDVRPILSDNCFECHGPDSAKRKADLRLDTGAPGQAIISAGKTSGSELFKRITHADPEERMPPEDSGRVLAPGDIETLRTWILQGAKWAKHWAFIPPGQPAIPPAKNSTWPSGGIDRFVLAKLQRAGLQPSPRADRETLLRRVSFDLTGLPPTPREIDSFLADTSPRAFEKVVDRLLASPRYGERMALDWLDAARYADSHGYSLDRRRVMWPWRDWVIRAFNDNLPFDQFALEQLAGDLLPDATIDQRVATGFNRNHSIQSEGGVINEEYRVETVVDRVETTSAVFLGLTFGCARCHDHKYDPISQREFYEFYALFNNVPETAHVGNADKMADKPFVKLPSAVQQKQMDRQRTEIAELEKKSESEQQLKTARKALAALGQVVPTAMIMGELSPARKTFVLSRGQYDQPSDVEVNVGLPAALGQWPASAPRNRLGLARWIVGAENPLTARVVMNRFWQMHFGTGIVKSTEDFGSQGEWPTHPALLDWLADEFVRSGWNRKAMHKLIVMSATYQQASRMSPQLLEADPSNRLFSRGPRFRLPAEMIRDHALASSGLLVGRLGGESVRPYQPPGLWDDVVYENVPRFVQDHGGKLYRRSMYTYWKRSVPPPNMQAFDAPSREVCVLTRAKTNTPLAALVLMNDPTFVEASRKLAGRVLRDGGATAESRLTLLHRLVCGRRPTERELGLLSVALAELRADYRAEPEAAQRLMEIGESPHDPSLDVAELAAYASLANAVLGTDEAITRN